MASSRRGAAGRALRQRALQLGFVGAALLVVVVADASADHLLTTDAGVGSLRAASLVVAGGRVVAGWALGMAFRMQFTRGVATDRQLRGLLGVPACLVASWPLLHTFLPPELVLRAPGWLAGGGALTAAAPVAAVALGLVLSLGVTARRG